MAYPFPGMNPFLEGATVWHNFHNRLIFRIQDAIIPQVRPKYITTSDENIYIHELSAEQRFLLGRPDVAIASQTRAPALRATTRESCQPLIEGMLSPAIAIDEIQENFIEIRDASTREVVTVIELLSPTNKAYGADREQYVSKRKRILRSNVHFVEIDLLRGGARMDVEGLPHCDYAVMVSRSIERPRVGLWPLRLRDRLPKIPIPLAGDDPDAVIDLQGLVELEFEAGGYEDFVYNSIPQPPLHPEDAAWAKQLREQT